MSDLVVPLRRSAVSTRSTNPTLSMLSKRLALLYRYMFQLYISETLTNFESGAPQIFVLSPLEWVFHYVPIHCFHL